jgi:hypothetical protein
MQLILDWRPEQSLKDAPYLVVAGPWVQKEDRQLKTACIHVLSKGVGERTSPLD